MPRVRRREHSCGPRPDDQDEDNEPAPVDAERDSGDAAEREGTTRRLTAFPGLLHGGADPFGDHGAVLACPLTCALDHLAPLRGRDAPPAAVRLVTECEDLPPGHAVILPVRQVPTQTASASEVLAVPYDVGHIVASPVGLQVLVGLVTGYLAVAYASDRCRRGLVAPGGVEPPLADSKSAALSTELRGRGQSPV
jgi:hypothetical protein